MMCIEWCTILTVASGIAACGLALAGVVVLTAWAISKLD